jgi:hypothetical protein
MAELGSNHLSKFLGLFICAFFLLSGCAVSNFSFGGDQPSEYNSYLDEERAKLPQDVRNKIEAESKKRGVAATAYYFDYQQVIDGVTHYVIAYATDLCDVPSDNIIRGTAPSQGGKTLCRYKYFVIDENLNIYSFQKDFEFFRQIPATKDLEDRAVFLLVQRIFGNQIQGLVIIDGQVMRQTPIVNQHYGPRTINGFFYNNGNNYQTELSVLYNGHFILPDQLKTAQALHRRCYQAWSGFPLDGLLVDFSSHLQQVSRDYKSIDNRVNALLKFLSHAEKYHQCLTEDAAFAADNPLLQLYASTAEKLMDDYTRTIGTYIENNPIVEAYKQPLCDRIIYPLPASLADLCPNTF